MKIKPKEGNCQAAQSLKNMSECGFKPIFIIMSKGLCDNFLVKVQHPQYEK